MAGVNGIVKSAVTEKAVYQEAQDSRIVAHPEPKAAGGNVLIHALRPPHHSGPAVPPTLPVRGPVACRLRSRGSKTPTRRPAGAGLWVGHNSNYGNSCRFLNDHPEGQR